MREVGYFWIYEYEVGYSNERERCSAFHQSRLPMISLDGSAVQEAFGQSSSPADRMFGP